MVTKLMKISSTILAFVLLFAFSFSAASATEFFGPAPLQPQLSSDGNTLYNAVPVVVYLADPDPPPQQARIPAPFNLRTLPEKATAAFSITYVANGGTDPWGASCTTFPDNAKTAFNAAGAIWGNLLTSSVPIKISACWSNLGSSSILGYSGGGTSYRNFTGAPITYTWYNSSLANALHGSNLGTSSSFDMYITYNSNFTWYYGTDGATPIGQYDLMSVVLHEMAHGLNFAGSMAYSGGTGSWGNYGVSPTNPSIYDTFMKNGSGNLLTSAYTNPSTALGSALTSTSIWFHGTNAVAANGGRVKIYAPSTWASGSSYAHLDYDTFKGTANRLMVYAISSHVSTHDPGPIALGMFKDMGWTPADVAIAIAGSPSSVIIGDNVTYSITVTNNSSNGTTNVTVTDILPAGVTFVSATPSQGACSGTNTVTCNLGTMNNGSTATISLVVTTTAANAALTNTASVTSDLTDPIPANNTATSNSTVVNNPVPAINSLNPLNPASATAGGGAFTLTVTGSNFVSNSKVQWGGADRTTAFVSATQLTAAIPAADIATAGTSAVTVFNPTPGGGTTDPLTFTTSNPAGGGGGGGGCFIATAAFGTPLEKHVQILRDFRDRVLLNSSAGKAFVQFYYRTSPAIADKIAQSEGIRFITRVMLMPVIGAAYLIVHLGMLMTMLLFTIIVLTVIFTIRILRKTIRKSARAKAAA